MSRCVGRARVGEIRRAAALPGRWALAALCVAAGALGCRDRVGQRWDWERMRQQPRYEAYGASAFFPDGKAMRTPPPGTIPHDGPVGPSIPFATPTTAMLTRGANRFDIFCAVCHGVRGDGMSIVASNMEDPRPPSLLTPRVRSLQPEQLHQVIVAGVGRMPPYGAELSEPDRWAVVAYIRTVLLQQPVDSSGRPAAPPGR